MRICVVGGTGSISRYILPLLIEAGHELAVFNRGQSLELPDGARQIIGDRRADRADFERRMRAEAFDAVIDFIAYDGEDAASTLRAFPDVARLIHISSCVVYGLDFPALPVAEGRPTAPPMALPNDYARGKLAADARIRQAIDVGYPATVVRFASTFGGYTGPRRQVTSQLAWLDRIRCGQPVVVADQGQARVQCLASEDAVAAVAGLLSCPAALGQTVNVVHPTPITWAAHHQTVMRVLGREVPLVPVPLDALRAAAIPGSGCLWENFAVDQHFDAARLQSLLPDWRPSVSLDGMLGSTIATLQDQGVIPDHRQPEFAWEDTLVAQYG